MFEPMKPGGEGNLVFNSDNIFGSTAFSSPTATIQNPNYKLFSLDNLNSSYIIPKEEYEMMSMIENGSGNDPVKDNAIEPQFPPATKKRLHRHTAHQIQQMEALYKENPHPDNKQRTRLSQELGLKPRQVKFWFQNKRTQFKAQQDRRENEELKAENEKLKTEHYNLLSQLKSVSCSSCGGPADTLRLQNSRFRQELGMLHSLMNPPPPPPRDTACFFSGTKQNKVISISEEEKAIAMDLAVSCVQELAKMCNTNEPLWNKKRSENNNESVSLNMEEYKKMFQWSPLGHDRFRREVSRAEKVVLMDSITIVNAFLDADKWSEMFCPIVAKAKTIQIISSGAYGASGSLLLMHAELQGLSPLVPTREAYFLRYAQQKKEEGRWVIVDFPIDTFHSLVKPVSATCADQCRRNPSGCIIQEMASGGSQVTWVEHVEVEEKQMLHKAVRKYVKSGMVFGAQRWLDVLKRHCEKMDCLMNRKITDLGAVPSLEAQRNLMRLIQTMVRNFCSNISSSSYEEAFSESTKDSVRITRSKVCGGDVICAVSNTFLPYSRQQVFDLLYRSQIFFNGNSLQQVACIASGSHLGDCISLLRINVATKLTNTAEFVLQESCTDYSGSLVVSSTINAVTLQLVLDGKVPSTIPLLPLGFSVVPVNSPEDNSINPSSCLLTVVIQDWASNVHTGIPNHSILTAINNRISSAVNKIISALGSSGSSAAGYPVLLKP